MPGTRITDQQVRLYIKIRKNSKSQDLAAAKAGISERSARRIESLAQAGRALCAAAHLRMRPSRRGRLAWMRPAVGRGFF